MMEGGRRTLEESNDGLSELFCVESMLHQYDSTLLIDDDFQGHFLLASIDTKEVVCFDKNWERNARLFGKCAQGWGAILANTSIHS